MAKNKDSRLKLPDDFLGTVTAFLNTPPPPKAIKKAGKPKAQKGAKRRRKP